MCSCCVLAIFKFSLRCASNAKGLFSEFLLMWCAIPVFMSRESDILFARTLTWQTKAFIKSKMQKKRVNMDMFLVFLDQVNNTMHG